MDVDLQCIPFQQGQGAMENQGLASF